MTDQNFVDSFMMLRRMLESEMARAEKDIELAASDCMKCHSEGARDALSMVYEYTSVMLDSLREASE